MGINTDNDSSSGWIDSGFIDRYLDYREGLTDEPPSFDGLTDEQRRDAEGWIELMRAAYGIDPYRQTPSIEDLCQRNPQLRQLLYGTEHPPQGKPRRHLSVVSEASGTR